MASRDDLRRSMRDISEHVGESMDALFAAPDAVKAVEPADPGKAAASRPRKSRTARQEAGQGSAGGAAVERSEEIEPLVEVPEASGAGRDEEAPAAEGATGVADTALMQQPAGELVFAPPIPTEADPLLDVGTYLDPEIEGELHRAAYLRGGEAEKSAIVRDALEAYLADLASLSADELERRLDAPRRDRTTGASRTPRTYRMRRSTKLTLLRIAGEHRVAMAALIRAALRDHLWGHDGDSTTKDR